MDDEATTERTRTLGECPFCKQLVRLDEEGRFHVHGRPEKDPVPFLDKYDRCPGSGSTAIDTGD